MTTSKKEVQKAVEQAEKLENKNAPKMTHIHEIWDVIEELEKNLNFINDKLKRVLDRMGLE